VNGRVGQDFRWGSPMLVVPGAVKQLLVAGLGVG